MNRIEIVNDTIKKISLDDSIDCKVFSNENLVNIKGIKLTIEKDTSLEIYYCNKEESKYDVSINVLDDVSFSLNEYREGKKIKIKYDYNLLKNSKVFVNKFYDASDVRELVTVNLNGINASFDYDFKTICKSKEKYDIVVYHNFKNTNSLIKNNGVNILDGELIFNVSGYVENERVDCIINQNSRIINLTNNKCQINPNLFINENDVEANHSALIGSFDSDEIFYMQSRGIDYNSAVTLLLKGFLSNSAINDEVLDKLIKKYWR